MDRLINGGFSIATCILQTKPVQIGEPVKSGKNVDWTGVQINEWKILKKIPYKKGCGMSAAQYEYECVYCGKRGRAAIYDLQNNIKHLDCPQKDERIGQVFGNLQILEFVKSTPHARFYHCKCIKCGYERTSQFDSIKNNHHQCITYPHIGESLGVYDIIGVEPKEKFKKVVYIAKCRECGRIKKTTYTHLKRDAKETCNHVTKFNAIKKDVGGWNNLRIRDIFYGMKVRCYDQNGAKKHWKYYGGKGIKICQEWLDNPKSFEEWSVSHGYNDSMSIDRIDSNKDYCPENCQWIPLSENSRKAGSKYITVNGITKNQAQWSLYLGMPRHFITEYKKKHSIEEIKKLIESYMKENGDRGK